MKFLSVAASVRYELYNLVEDPKESSNVAAQETDRAKTMGSALETWLGSVVRSLNGLDDKQ